MIKDNRYIFWILGPTASGKTSIGEIFAKILSENDMPVIHYDGDEIRHLLGPNLGFESQDRLTVVSIIGYLANKSLRSGMNVVVSALTANDDARHYIRNHVDNIIIIYLECNIEKCIERDYKGLYRKALNGEIETLIGINTEYVPFKKPDIILKSENKTIDECAQELLEFFKKKFN